MKNFRLLAGLYLLSFVVAGTVFAQDDSGSTNVACDQKTGTGYTTCANTDTLGCTRATVGQVCGDKPGGSCKCRSGAEGCKCYTGGRNAEPPLE